MYHMILIVIEYSGTEMLGDHNCKSFQTEPASQINGTILYASEREGQAEHVSRLCGVIDTRARFVAHTMQFDFSRVVQFCVLLRVSPH